MIYFIKSNDGPIKIGIARSPLQRLKALQCSNAATLTLLGTIKGRRKDEKKLHEQFSHLKLSGEWFKPNQELLTYIEKYKEVIADEGPHFILLPGLEKMVKDVGLNIKLARLRRKISAEMLAQRMGVSRPTLRKVEDGDARVTIGVYAQALFCLGLQKDIALLGFNDTLGRALQDAKLLRKRAPKVCNK